MKTKNGESLVALTHTHTHTHTHKQYLEDDKSYEDVALVVVYKNVKTNLS